MRDRVVTAAGVDLHCTEAGDGPLVVLSRGFPELAYSWRHQLPALAAAGHWVQQEKPAPVDRHLVDFLDHVHRRTP